MDSENTKKKSEKKSVPLKTLKLRALLTKEEKEEFLVTSEMNRWYYNCALDILNRDDNMKKCAFGKNISSTKLRDTIRTYDYFEDKRDVITFMDFVCTDQPKHPFPKPDHWSKIHNRIPRGAIHNLVGNLNSARSNKRNGNITSYRLKYKTKKDKNYTITFEDAGYPKWINKLKAWYRYGRKRISFLDLLKQIKVKNLILSMDRETGKFYICLPVDASWTPNCNENQVSVEKNEKHPYISLDTGVRTFQTGFSSNHIISIGSRGGEKLSLLLLKADGIQKEIDSCMNNRKRKRLRKQKLHTYRKLRFLVDDIHWKTCSFLVDNYDCILLPDFRITGMVKNSFSRMTKRLLYIYSYFRFKQRLSYKSELEGVRLCIVDESYTSKTCGRCGNLNAKLGSSKVFNCPYCGLVIDRDVNGARNILIKNWPALQGH